MDPGKTDGSDTPPSPVLTGWQLLHGPAAAPRVGLARHPSGAAQAAAAQAGAAQTAAAADGLARGAPQAVVHGAGTGAQTRGASSSQVPDAGKRKREEQGDSVDRTDEQDVCNREAMAVDWVSLPTDVVGHIADCFLATNDLDYYMDFRAVCHTWRSSTADPRADPQDPRFQPRRWVALDGVCKRDAPVFANAATGRFVSKDLPMLSRYLLVAGAGGGQLVLADRSRPHAARVLNPFTGSLIRFEAPVPPEPQVVAHVIGSSPTLVLVCGHSRTIYWADPDEESFHVHKEEQHHPSVWMALMGGIYSVAREHGSLSSLLVAAANNILGMVSNLFSNTAAGEQSVIHGSEEGEVGFVVESEGETLVVFKKQHRMTVFRINAVANVLEPVKDIGSRALFVGDWRCLSVDAAKFASIEANCIYYVTQSRPDRVCIYSLKNENGVRIGVKDEIDVSIGGVIDFLNPGAAVKLFSRHTWWAMKSDLAWEITRVRRETIARVLAGGMRA